MYRFTASFWCAAGILKAFQNPPRASTEDDIFGSSFFVLPTQSRNILLASHLVGYGTTIVVPTLAIHQVHNRWMNTFPEILFPYQVFNIVTSCTCSAEAYRLSKFQA